MSVEKRKFADRIIPYSNLSKSRDVFGLVSNDDLLDNMVSWTYYLHVVFSGFQQLLILLIMKNLLKKIIL